MKHRRSSYSISYCLMKWLFHPLPPHHIFIKLPHPYNNSWQQHIQYPNLRNVGPPNQILFPARITRNGQYNRDILSFVLRWWEERKVHVPICWCHLTWRLLSRWQHCFWARLHRDVFPLHHRAELILTSLNQLMISHHRKPSCGMMTDYNVPSGTDTPEMCMWSKRRTETSFGTGPFSFYLKGPGLKAVLGTNMWLCIQCCKSKSALCSLPPKSHRLTNHLLVWF